jgi:hypothetical protein
MRSLLFSLLIVVAACNCHDDKGAPVTPRPEPRDVPPKALTLDDYEAAVYAAGPTSTFAPTTPTEHEAVAKLVPALLDAAWSPTPPATPAKWQAAAASAGFRIEAWTIQGDRYWALVEVPGRERGAGAYIFRVAPRTSGEPVILLQAPHNFFDLGTGRLAADVFFAPRQGIRPRALFTNTIHRYQLTPGDKKKRKDNPADVAHNPEHAFTIATDAFAIAAGHARVIQLHGFGAREEIDGEGDVGAIAMVISAGSKTASSPLSGAIAAAATKVFGPDVRRYPEDTSVLGATTNSQKRVLEKSRRGDFVHIEMSSEVRKKLAASEELRTQLAAVLFDTNGDLP